MRERERLLPVTGLTPMRDITHSYMRRNAYVSIEMSHVAQRNESCHAKE